MSWSRHLTTGFYGENSLVPGHKQESKVLSKSSASQSFLAPVGVGSRWRFALSVVALDQ